MRSFSLLLLATPLLTLLQETPQQRPRPGTQTESQDRGTANRSDGLLAGWVLIDSNNEIALAQIAEQRSRNQEVKQYAQQMIADHRELAQKLQRYASSAGFSTTMPGVTGGAGGERRDGDDDRNGRDGDDDRHDGEHGTGGAGERGTGGTQGQQPRPGETQRPGDTRGNTGFGTTGDVNHVQLIQEIGKKCLESSRKELEQRSGADFDRFYMNLMVIEHMRVNDTLDVFQRHASGELKSVFSEGKRTVETHLQHAKQLAKRFDSEGYSGQDGNGRMDGDDRKGRKDDDDDKEKDKDD